MPGKPPKVIKPISINVAIYRLHVIIFVEWTVEAMIRFGRQHKIGKEQFTDEWLRMLHSSRDGAQGLCTRFGVNNRDILVWLAKRPTRASEYGTLWHELLHAVDFIAEGADPGNRFSDENGISEPRAFLYEYLAVEASKALWNIK
jgi:hypothetical protein